MSTDLIGNEIQNKLKSINVKVSCEPQTAQAVIRWRRQLFQNLTGSTQKNLQLTESIQYENQVLWLISGEDLVNFVNEKVLIHKIETISKLYPTCTMTLLVCGLKAHCKKNRGCVSRTTTEFALTEIQLFLNCSYRFIESDEELAITVMQFTKSIAENPFKQQKMDKYEKENYYLGNDSKDCVKCQNGIGLARLFTQQLIKLPMVTLEVAEAITSVYPMPMLLISALEDSESPMDLLADLPIRRAGPLSSTRRIGNEISRKVYNLMMSLDRDTLI